MMIYDFQQVAALARERYVLSRKGIHGVGHWQRVQENGMKLAKSTGANRDIVRLFSFLHDCCREDDGHDPEHGPRAAEFTRTLKDSVIIADDALFEKLVEAIHDHTLVTYSTDPDISTCWDADRLDIGRVGVKPNPRLLNNAIAKDKRILNWAYKRSRVGR